MTKMFAAKIGLALSGAWAISAFVGLLFGLSEGGFWASIICSQIWSAMNIAVLVRD